MTTSAGPDDPKDENRNHDGNSPEANGDPTPLESGDTEFAQASEADVFTEPAAKSTIHPSTLSSAPTETTPQDESDETGPATT